MARKKSTYDPRHSGNKAEPEVLEPKADKRPAKAAASKKSTAYDPRHADRKAEPEERFAAPDRPEKTTEGERIAKVMARAGVASRRESEKLIAEGRVAINGEAVTSPARNVGSNDVVTLDGSPLTQPEPARLWRYHKPAGLVTTHKDPEGRDTVFASLPKTLPRVVSVGRLDVNSEGLLLLTNDGELAGRLENPKAGLRRRYRVRLFGKVTQADFDKLAEGITIDGVRYGPIVADLERSKGMYSWAGVTLSEGRNREIKRVMESLGLKVARLIRVSYGPFQLGQLPEGGVEEIPAKLWRTQLGIGRKKHD